jgi:hypothetical protein
MASIAAGRPGPTSALEPHGMDRGEQPAPQQDGAESPPAVRQFLGVRPWAWILGGLLTIVAFFVTLWLTEPELPPGSGIATLAKAPVAGSAELLAAIDAAGLARSELVRGNIDTLNRLDGSRVAMSGWAAQVNGVGSPLSVMAFPDAQHVFQTETKGERADVTSALRLSAGAAANVGFALVLSCRPGQRVMVIAATQSNLFTPLEAPVCP